MGALNLSQVLWEERRALVGEPLEFAPKKDSAPGTSPTSAPSASEAAPTPVSSASATSTPAPQQFPETSPGSSLPPACPETLLDVFRVLNADDRWALCLSGGAAARHSRSASCKGSLLSR